MSLYPALKESNAIPILSTNVNAQSSEPKKCARSGVRKQGSKARTMRTKKPGGSRKRQRESNRERPPRGPTPRKLEMRVSGAGVWHGHAWVWGAWVMCVCSYTKHMQNTIFCACCCAVYLPSQCAIFILHCFCSY